MRGAGEVRKNLKRCEVSKVIDRFGSAKFWYFICRGEKMRKTMGTEKGEEMIGKVQWVQFFCSLQNCHAECWVGQNLLPSVVPEGVGMSQCNPQIRTVFILFSILYVALTSL